MGGGGMMGGMLGAGPATPELLAQVAALPPSTEQPEEIPPDHSQVQSATDATAGAADCWSSRWSWSPPTRSRT